MKNMKLSTKLIVLFLLVGVLPAAVIGTIALVGASSDMKDPSKVTFGTLTSVRDIKKQQIETYFSEREGDMGVLVNTVGTLRQEAFAKLTASREVKRSAVERYFQSIEDQIVTFSEDRMVVEAMSQFASDFSQFRSENNFSEDDLKLMRSQLASYYTDDFSQEYKSQNKGQSANAGQFLDQLDDDSIAFQHHHISGNPHPLGSKHLMDRASDQSAYSKAHDQNHPIIRNYLEKFGYYDIFLVDPETGDIVYSVFKELDFSTSLIDGPYAQTNFGEAFRKANSATNKDEVVLVDYKKYTPSYDAPASFIASPIFDGDKKIGVAIFQMPIDRLNAIMEERAGLGETGETYLVGPDQLMRSNSYLDPEFHSVVESFKNPDKGRVDTAAANDALAGKVGSEVIIDYNGNPVLSAYTPVKVGNFTWGLLAEIDVAEAFCPKDDSGISFYQKYVETYGYYDLFLMNPDGFCFYTVAQEADYQTNLIDGPYRSSGLGRLVQKVLANKQYGFEDFEPYAPSNDEPAAFIAQPVIHDGKTDLVVALQLPLDAINSIMGTRSGMGETGESYLVGPDKLMRSDSYLDPVNHTVIASFADPSKGSANTDAVNAALSGKQGQEVIIDYNGNPVLSAYAPIQVGKTTWAILAEVDEAEAYAGLKSLKLILAAVGAIALVVIGIVSLLFSRSVTGPITRAITMLSEGALKVGSASTQISKSSLSLAEGATQQASSLEESAASLQLMASKALGNADQSGQASTMMEESKVHVQEGSTAMSETVETMNQMQESSKEMAGIVGTIEEIAFQTNLLALNAAVEAARAGQHGQGFAVVADEVRNLAQRAAQASRDTASLIVQSVEQSEKGTAVVSRAAEALEKIAESATIVGSIVGEISTASSEQADGVGKINRAVSEVDKVTHINASSAEQAASASEELSAQSDQLSDIIGDLVQIVGGSGSNGKSGIPGSRG
ncbi:MAG: methyl-accepting chemotaxis protein [Planctomycetaceae bacterium]|nr:methyl-accepting chemotaxis protein [Planctomycetaceae bacterium]